MIFELIVTSWILLISLYLYSANYSKKRPWLAETFKRFPGPPEHPIIGSGYVFMCPTEDFHQKTDELRNTFGPRYRVRIGPELAFFLHDPQDIEVALQTQHKSRFYDVLGWWLGQGLLTAKGGPKWHSDRKMLTPAFHFQTLRNFFPAMNQSAQVLVNIIRRDFSEGKELDIDPYLARYALDTLCATAMGTNINMQNEQNSLYLNTILRTMELTIYATLRPWLQPLFFLPKVRELKANIKILQKFTNEVIVARKEARKLISGKDGVDKSGEDDADFGSKSEVLLDTLLNAQDTEGSALSDSSIREQIDTFMFAGHDTAKSTILWALLYIGSHLEVQKKIHEEIDSIMGQDANRSLELSDLLELKYLEQCIKESMRIQSPIAIVVRKVTTDLTLADGTILPEGSTTMSSIRGVHKDERYYQNPNVYDPDRFSPENSLGRHPYAYIPFAAGPRNCIGQKFAMMELKIVLANIFRQFTVYAPSPSDIKPAFRIVLEPAHGLPLRFRSRWETP